MRPQWLRYSRVILSTLLLLPALVAAAELDDVRADLAADIQRAQQALSATHLAIGEERGVLAEQINRAQTRVLELRERAVAARRVADEETLSLEQIENRITAWREQSQFQTRLLAGFLNRVREPGAAVPGSGTMLDYLQAFSELLAGSEAYLYPAWQSERLVLADGQLAEAEVLSLGPVQWYRRGEQAGLANDEGLLTRVTLDFEPATAAGLQALSAGGSGQLVFDPTLSRALLLADDEETLLEHVQKGGIWVVPILLFALFATTIAACKGLALYRLPALMPGVAERIEHAHKAGDGGLQKLLAQLKGHQGALARTALSPHQSLEQRDDRLYALLLEQRNSLERWLGAIAMTASVSPLLGLLGTVSGMIATFKLMTLFGAGDANAVSAGISEALVTTELGLVVAIPALLAHALMSRKVKNYFAGLENDAVHLSQLPLTTNMKPGAPA